jgi:anti-sigma B factor antagonist
MDSSNLKSIQIVQAGEDTVVSLYGEMAHEHATELDRVIQQLFEDNKRQLIIDFRQCDFIDSCALGSIVNGLKTAQRINAKIRLQNVPEKIQELLMISQVDKLFEVS